MVVTRWVAAEDSRDTIMAVQAAGFLSGHGHLLSEAERALFADPTIPPKFTFSWEPLPPFRLIALAVEGPRIVGTLSLHRESSGGSYAVVEPMAVLPEFQSRGIGRELWVIAAAHCKHSGDKGMRVWALDRNTRAIDFYMNKIGCYKIGTGQWTLGQHQEPATGFQFDL